MDLWPLSLSTTSADSRLPRGPTGRGDPHLHP